MPYLLFLSTVSGLHHHRHDFLKVTAHAQEVNKNRKIVKYANDSKLTKRSSRQGKFKQIDMQKRKEIKNAYIKVNKTSLLAT